VLAVDLGGTHLRCAVVEPDATVVHRRVADTPKDQHGVDVLVAMVQDVHAGLACDLAVVGAPGRVDYAGGRLEHAPNLAPDWVPALTEQHLSDAVGLPVRLANDADLAAVGEAWFGAGRGAADVAYVTFSTGVGAGVVLGRRLVRAARSLAEVGHTVLSLEEYERSARATVEDFASGTALARLAREAGVPSASGGGVAVVAAVREGDPAAISVWREVVAAAGATVVNVAWLFTPEVIVVGGGLGLVGEMFLAPLRDALRDGGPPALPRPIEVAGATLGDDAGLAGAAAWVEACGLA
jgi:glucokinase